MQRGSLAELDPASLGRAFNLAYEDYVVPLHFNDARLRLHLHAHDIVLDESPLLRDRDGTFVALAMLGVRNERGWVGGFGVAPAHRGRGLARTLCADVIERARALGLARLQLEVIDVNARAIATYVRAGFVRTRVLRSFRRDPGEAVSRAEVVDLDVDAFAWSRRPATPSWQRERASACRMPGLAAIACEAGEAVVSVTGPAVHVLALVTEDERSAARLLHAVASKHPDRATVVMNEPEGSVVERAMARAGWTTIVRQHEMVLDLAGPAAAP